jgi:YD repeat-containing protein
MAGSLTINAAHWNLRGPVRSMRSDIAERDLARSDWGAARFHAFVVFDESGRVLQLDQRGVEDSVYRQTYEYDGAGRLLEWRGGSAGGAVTHLRSCRYDERGRVIEVVERADGVDRTRERHTYDDRGRRTRIETVDAAMRAEHVAFGVDGSETAYGAPGAKTIRTSYDEQGRSTDVVFENDAGIVVQRIVFTRDSAGRVLTEEAFQNADALMPDSSELSEHDRTMMLALISQVYGSIRTTNEYDPDGRLARRTRAMGTLGVEVTTFTHNEHGDVTQESQVSTNREMRFGEDGQPEATPDVTHVEHTRFSYEYDARGNWTSRTVSVQVTSDVFTPQNIERRTIEYYGQC